MCTGIIAIFLGFIYFQSLLHIIFSSCVLFTIHDANGDVFKEMRELFILSYRVFNFYEENNF